MRVTRRLWAVLALSGFLAVMAAGLEQPLLLAGSALIGAWVLAAQYSFLGALKRTAAAVSVTQSPLRSVVRTGESAPVTLATTLDEQPSLFLGIDAGVPTATTADSLHVLVSPGTTSAEQTTQVSWPITGQHQFDAPRLTATDGLFVETIVSGNQPAVTVEPREPRALHVGEGGDRLASAYGEYESARLGSGVEPAEIREYTPGDAASRIDWKATARFSTPHIREYETNANQPTLLVVDHRTPLSTGPPNETKLDYLREIVLASAKNAHAVNDPIGLLGVGDEGITTSLEPTTSESYGTVRRKLMEVEPDPNGTERVHTDTPNRTNVGVVGSLHTRPTLQTVRRSVSDLEYRTDPFAAALYPFYADGRTYRHRIREQPLFNAVRTMLASTSKGMWTVIFTDDSNPAELRETVSLARRDGARVTVFLAPTVLYDSHGSSDLERAHNRYLEFEEFRRELTSIDRVRAFEVGPGDRLSAILETERMRGDQR